METKVIKQRATKVEASLVSEALKLIWVEASESQDPVVFSFPDTSAGRLDCRNLHDSLGKFRKRVSQKKLENLLLWEQVNSLQLCKATGDTSVTLVKKKGVVSSKSRVVLLAAEKLANKGNSHKENNVIDSIVSDI